MIMRLGMFVRATFRGQTIVLHTDVPASAIMHIHDRDYVYTPAPENKFRRVEVVGGDDLPNNMQEVRSGLKPGQQVVTNALGLGAHDRPDSRRPETTTGGIAHDSLTGRFRLLITGFW